MLKKHNKLILLLVLATFMFTIVGSASAAQFSDVSGSPVQTAAIYKLNALGIIEGYPDGTFGPDRTISRAEFAKIAVNMAGLQAVASGMANTPSVFKDINTGDWFNGFVNVAAAQGYVKGDPNGTFRPNDQVTQGEAITVMMRLLGYNDNLPGDWPADYIAKAANLEILDDITFVANKAATRAEIACMGSETLDQYVVEYQADSNTFINDVKVDVDDLDKDGNKKEQTTYTLVEDKFKGGLTEDALVAKYIVPDKEDGQYKLEYYTYINNVWTKDTVTVAKNFVVANGKSILDTAVKFVDFIVNDDDEAVFIAINDYGTVKDDAMTCKNFVSGLATRVEFNDKDYDFADDVLWNPNSGGVPYLQMRAGKQEGADWYTAVLNDDGDVAAVNVSTQPAPGIVDYVNAERETISFKVNPESYLSGLGTSYGNKVTDLANNTYFVARNGVPAKLADIKEGDIVFVMVGQDDYGLNGFAGVDYFINAIDPSLVTVKGTLSSVEANADGTLKKVTIADKEYKVINAADYSAARAQLTSGTLLTNITVAPTTLKPQVSTDGGDDYEVITNADFISGDNYDLLDEEVTAILTPNGKVGLVISDVDSADSGKIFASVISIVKGTTKGSELVNMIKVVNKEDKEMSYAIDDDTTFNGRELANINAVADQLALGDMVALTLTADGNIDNIKTTDIKTTTVAAAADVDDDLDSIKINGSWYSAKDVVVYNYKTADEDTEVMQWSDIQDTIKSGTGLTFDYYIDGSEVKYIAITDAPLNTDTNYAIYVKNGKDSDDPYAVIILDGKEQKVYLNNDASYTELKKYKKGNLLAFKYEGSDMRVIPRTTVQADIIGGGYAEVTDVKTKQNIVEINNVAYLVDEDTLVFDATDHDNLAQLTLDDIARGDEVYAVFDKDDKVLAAIVVTDQDDAADMGISAVNSGSTTVAVTGVTLSASALSLTAGGATGTLTATVAPANATNKTVTWTSSNTAVATVANGVVTPVAAGTAVITVTTADGAKTATCTVTVTGGGAVEPACTATFTKTATVGAFDMGTVTIALTGVSGASTFTVTYTVAGQSKTTTATAVPGPSKTITKNDTVTIKVYDAAGTLLQTFNNVAL